VRHGVESEVYKGMKVILTQDVPKLGSFGEIVNVKDGYGRNFLVPKGIALAHNEKNLRAIGDKRKKREIEFKKQKEEAQAIAEKLSNASCTIAVKIIEEDRIFGSVTPEMVQKALEIEGITIDKRAVQIGEPIKKLGVYQVTLKVHPEVTANCKVWVVKE